MNLFERNFPEFRKVFGLSSSTWSYGRIIYHNDSRYSQRVITPMLISKDDWKREGVQITPFIISFAKKYDGRIIKVGSTREVYHGNNWIEFLRGALENYEAQLTTPDISCDRCNSGRYQALSGPVMCFRCQGKGWQNFNDQKRNEIYDMHHAI